MRNWLQRVHGAPTSVTKEIRAGDHVRVWFKIRERDRVRTTPFEGLVIRVRGGGPSRTMTVRRVTFGEGVERMFFPDGPTVDHIELLRRGDVRRSRLYFLRRAIGKTRITFTSGAPSGDTTEALLSSNEPSTPDATERDAGAEHTPAAVAASQPTEPTSSTKQPSGSEPSES